MAVSPLPARTSDTVKLTSCRARPAQGDLSGHLWLNELSRALTNGAHRKRKIDARFHTYWSIFYYIMRKCTLLNAPNSQSWLKLSFKWRTQADLLLLRRWKEAVETRCNLLVFVNRFKGNSQYPSCSAPITSSAPNSQTLSEPCGGRGRGGGMSQTRRTLGGGCAPPSSELGGLSVKLGGWRKGGQISN